MAVTAITYERGSRQAQGLWSEMWVATGTVDFASGADGVGATQTMALPGVALGDQVIATSINVDLQGQILTGYVSAADVVSFRLQNEAASTIDLASCTIKAIVGRPSF